MLEALGLDAMPETPAWLGHQVRCARYGASSNFEVTRVSVQDVNLADLVAMDVFACTDAVPQT